MALIVGFLTVHVGAGADRAEEPARHGLWLLVEEQRCPVSAENHPGVDAKLLIKDAANCCPIRRAGCFCAAPRASARWRCSTGCDIIDGPTAESALRVVSRSTIGVQARLFSPTTLAPNFRESAIMRPFPFNADLYAGRSAGHRRRDYQLEIGGLVENKKPWTLSELYVCRRCRDQRVRSRRGPASAIGLARACGSPILEADRRRHRRAKYVRFQCAEGDSRPSTCRPRCTGDQSRPSC